MSQKNVRFAQFTRKTYIISFTAAPIRAPIGTDSVIIWWTNLRGEILSLSLRDVIVGILNRNDLLNYLRILGKLCIWECRRNKSLPKFNIFL